MKTNNTDRSVIWVVDRIEGSLAVVDTGDGRLEIPLSALPKDTKEGTVLRLASDPDEEARRKQTVRSLFDRLRVD